MWHTVVGHCACVRVRRKMLYLAFRYDFIIILCAHIERNEIPHSNIHGLRAARAREMPSLWPISERETVRKQESQISLIAYRHDIATTAAAAVTNTIITAAFFVLLVVVLAYIITYYISYYFVCLESIAMQYLGNWKQCNATFDKCQALQYNVREGDSVHLKMVRTAAVATTWTIFFFSNGSRKPTHPRAYTHISERKLVRLIEVIDERRSKTQRRE